MVVLLLLKTKECEAFTRTLCDLGGEDHVTIEKDMTTREFRLLTNSSSSSNGDIAGATINNTKTTNGSRRLTASQSVIYATKDVISIPRRLQQQQQQVNNNDNTGDSVRHFSARRCECADRLEYDRDYYCKSSASHCAVPVLWSNSPSPPVCLDYDPARDAIKYVFLFVLAFYGMVLWYLFSTQNGRDMFHGIITLCCFRPGTPAWNTRLVRQIQRHDQRRTNHLLQSYWRRRRRLLPEQQHCEMINNRNDQTSNNNNNNNNNNNDAAQDNNVTLEPEEQPKPAHLALRTRTYHRSDHYPSKNDKGVESVEKERGQDDNEHACTICFGLLVEGDRVGALNCGHVFSCGVSKDVVVETKRLSLVRHSGGQGEIRAGELHPGDDRDGR